MSTVRVLLPVLKGRIFFVVDKGRHWSVIEHLLLEALVRRGWTSEDLSQQGAIPRRVVVEAVVRLMRAGWAELLLEEGGVKFRATALGGAAAMQPELPRLADLRRRPTNYVLDTVCGEIFRNKDVLTQAQDEINKNPIGDRTVWIEPRSWESAVDINSALAVLLDADESFVSGQPGGLYRRWVSVLVRDGVIVSGLPESRQLSELRQVVLNAAQADGGGVPEARIPTDSIQDLLHSSTVLPKVHSAALDMKDLVLGGERHREVLEWVLSAAQSQVFIHSTFISQSRVEDLLPLLSAAVERGVKIQVFWGQNEDVDEKSSTRLAIADLRRNIHVQRLAENLLFHPNSTGSHAKLIVADCGHDGGFVAIVGSCNWLTSGFVSYEVSVVLTEPSIVREIVGYFAKLVCMHDGMWSDLASDMARICQSLENAPPNARSNSEMSVVIGGQHNDYVLRARDQSRRRVLLASHRLGAASKPGILVPLQRAAIDSGIDVEIFYCRRTAPVKAAAEKRIGREAADAGVELTLVESPRLHGKFMLWDSDDVVITSLNWLSADQTDSQSLAEIGVHIHSPGAAEIVRKDFLAAISAAS